DCREERPRVSSLLLRFEYRDRLRVQNVGQSDEADRVVLFGNLAREFLAVLEALRRPDQLPLLEHQVLEAVPGARFRVASVNLYAARFRSYAGPVTDFPSIDFGYLLDAHRLNRIGAVDDHGHAVESDDVCALRGREVAKARRSRASNFVVLDFA